MKIFRTLAIVTSLISPSVWGELYIVQKGDSLSQIVSRYYFNVPNIPTYGRNGRLQKILKINPKISPSKFIFPGQRILMISLPKQEFAQVDSSPPPATPPEKLFMNFHVGYGASSDTFQQKKSLGEPKGDGVFALNAFDVGFDAESGQWFFSGNYFRSSQELSSETETQTAKFSDLYFRLGHDAAGLTPFIGIRSNQAPVIRLRLTDFDLVGLQSTWADLGVRIKKTSPQHYWLLQGNLGKCLGGSIDHGGVQTENLSGTSVSAEGKFARKMKSMEFGDFYLGLESSARWQKQSFSVTWDGTSGDVERTEHSLRLMVFSEIGF